MTLKDAVEGKEYFVEKIVSDDEEMKSFLFTLGCYEGEPITVIAHRRGSCTIAIKDGRYSIDSNLASVIYIRN